LVKVGVIQIKIRNPQENFEKIEDFMTEAKNNQAEVVCLPEKWNTTGPMSPIEEESGETYNFLSKMARKFEIYLVGGAITINSNKENFVISYIFDPNGNCIGKQKKIHLYSYENKYVKSGNELEIIKTKFGLIGVAICFDLNAFPEIGRSFALNGVNLIFNPSMIYDVGIENWHIYLKARALENRMPIIGINSVGKAPSGHSLTGESIIIGFYKGHQSPAKLKIIQGKKNEEQLIFADLDLSYPMEIRKKRLSNMRTFKIKNK